MSAKQVENLSFHNDASKNIFSHPCIPYMASEKVQREKQFHSKSYLLEMPRCYARIRLKSA